MQEIQRFYLQFLNFFPEFLHPFISIAAAIVVVYAVVQVIRKDFIWLIALVILLPASVPILKSIGQGIVELVKFLLRTG